MGNDTYGKPASSNYVSPGLGAPDEDGHEQDPLVHCPETGCDSRNYLSDWAVCVSIDVRTGESEALGLFCPNCGEFSNPTLGAVIVQATFKPGADSSITVFTEATLRQEYRLITEERVR